MVYPFPPMKDLHGTASAVVPAPLDRCRALFEAVDRYPDWYPDAVREVDVLERDHTGRPTKARAKLHLVWGPVVKDFDLVLAVVSEPPGPIRLTRIADAGSSQFAVTWGSGTTGARASTSTSPRACPSHASFRWVVSATRLPTASSAPRRGL